jgi:hypothetical protein
MEPADRRSPALEEVAAHPAAWAFGSGLVRNLVRVRSGRASVLDVALSAQRAEGRGCEQRSVVSRRAIPPSPPIKQPTRVGFFIGRQHITAAWEHNSPCGYDHTDNQKR